MSVTVTAPKTRVVSRGSCVFSWTPQYPQSRYEIQYRKKGESAWSTMGAVSSGSASVTLDLSAFEDFQEYHYRIVCYSDNAQSGNTTYSGSDTSPAYSLVVCPAAAVRSLRLRYGDGMLEVPLYESTDHGPRLRQKASDGIAETALVPPDAALATPLRVRVGGETKALPAGYADLEDPGVPGSAALYANQKAYRRYSYTYLESSYLYYGNYLFTYYYSYKTYYKNFIGGRYQAVSYWTDRFMSYYSYYRQYASVYAYLYGYSAYYYRYYINH